MSPPASPTPSPPDPSKRSGSHSPLSLDLSSIPPLIQPSPPSNTLLITNLNNPLLFEALALEKIKTLVASRNSLNSFAPLRSFHRIIISYHDTDAAISTRQFLDGASTQILLPQNPDGSNITEQNTHLHHDRIRCYFGEPTPVYGEDFPDQHLKAPNPGKLFFISPPPSPPCGWEIREEDPPNKETHAEDLERALAGLNHKFQTTGEDEMADAGAYRTQDTRRELDEDGITDESDVEARRLGNRGRTKSTTVYHPKDHGSKEDLPAVVVSDMSETEDGPDGHELSGGPGKQVITHTSRPPVELMEE